MLQTFKIPKHFILNMEDRHLIIGGSNISLLNCVGRGKLIMGFMTLEFSINIQNRPILYVSIYTFLLYT